MSEPTRPNRSALLRVGEQIDWQVRTDDRIEWPGRLGRVRGTVKAVDEHGIRLRTTDNDLYVLPWSELIEVCILQPWVGDNSERANAMRALSR
jgi:small-conductance mechanosensitive channel